MSGCYQVNHIVLLVWKTYFGCPIAALWQISWQIESRNPEHGSIFNRSKVLEAFFANKLSSIAKLSVAEYFKKASSPILPLQKH